MKEFLKKWLGINCFLKPNQIGDLIDTKIGKKELTQSEWVIVTQKATGLFKKIEDLESKLAKLEEYLDIKYQNYTEEIKVEKYVKNPEMQPDMCDREYLAKTFGKANHPKKTNTKSKKK